jgi:hypothetical protein
MAETGIKRGEKDSITEVGEENNVTKSEDV